MSPRLLSIFAVSASLSMGLGEALAASAEPPGAVQVRRFRPQHELSVGVGYLPLDPLTKGVTGSLGYTFHFNDHFAWRVAEVGVVSGLRSSIRKDLQNNYGRQDREFVEPTLLATSEVVWQALYGRESFLNRGVLWTGTTLHLGGGGAMMRADGETLPKPAALVGLGMKIHIDESWASRLEARYMWVVEEFALELPTEVLWLTLSATWSLGTQ